MGVLEGDCLHPPPPLDSGAVKGYVPHVRQGDREPLARWELGGGRASALHQSTRCMVVTGTGRLAPDGLPFCRGKRYDFVVQ